MVAAARSVNLAMVYAYFEAGRIIMEEEQAGSDRAACGKRVLSQVSERLTADFGRGFSMTSLPTTSTGRRFFLSWSHYVFLMRINNIDERHFYEIESATQGWSLKELERHFVGTISPTNGDKKKARRTIRRALRCR